MTRMEALRAAKRHREAYGNTLDEHDPVDYGDLLLCEDCTLVIQIDHEEFS